MELHRLLARQLRRLDVQANQLPPSLETWQEFLNFVNKAYVEADQERYLLERSMEISSRELLALNEKRKKNETEILDLHQKLLKLVRATGEEDISVLHQRLLNMARDAGMADVAGSILHNVGNILSSANTSVDLLEENIRQDYYKKCLSLLSMMKANSSNLTHYLTQDAKGKLIPEYLVGISDTLENEYQKLRSEIENLKKYIQHIRDIVLKQQTLSGVSGFNEKLDIVDIIDMALQITGLPEKREILLRKTYAKVPKIITDKTKVLQILVNLLKNAQDSVMSRSDLPQRKMDIRLELLNGDQLAIHVIDNGVGVASEKLIQIFSFGYSTKKEGHGFGLHNSALAAIEVGGKLTVKSEGINCGATFTLILPLDGASKGAKIV